MDQHEYTLDDEDRKAQDVILKPDPCGKATMVLKKTLSCSYPDLPFEKALQKENEKLQLELQRSQANMDVSQSEVIQHLLDVTEVIAASSVVEQGSPVKPSKKAEADSEGGRTRELSYNEGYPKKSESHSSSRFILVFYIKDIHK